MSTFISYLLVIPLVQFCLTIGTFLGGMPIALLLAWAPTSLRVRVAGFSGGVSGVVLSVAFGYGVFRFFCGPQSFTFSALLASTLPLLLPIRNDLLHSRRLKASRDKLFETVAEQSGEDAATRMTESLPADASDVVGEVVGLGLVVAWYFDAFS